MKQLIKGSFLSSDSIDAYCAFGLYAQRRMQFFDSSMDVMMVSQTSYCPYDLYLHMKGVISSTIRFTSL